MTVSYRLVPPRILWWVWLAFVALNIADFTVQGGSARLITVVVAILLAGTGIVYALALRPRVMSTDAGVDVVNPFRDYQVPWAAIESVDTGEWVRVHCGQRTITCWALYVSARSRRAILRGRPVQSRPGREYSLAELSALPATAAIAARLDSLAARHAGEDAATVQVRWSRPALLAVVAPLLALVVVAVV